MNLEFSGRTIIVTGGGHGLGRAMAQAFAQLGGRVWTCDVVEDELAETQESCDPACEVRTVDVRDREGVKSFVEEASRESGRVDILVNNAGGVVGQVGRPLEEVAPEEWQVIFDVNLTGAFNFAQAVAPGMKEAAWGRIVNISSGAGLRVSLTGIQAYASAKSGLIGLTRQLAHELGPSGITVNCVAPGFVRSNPTTERQWEAYGEEGQRRLVESIAMRRLGRPEDIAHAVLFFSSDYASWITGQTLSVDGGR
ncbi:MAG: SDR family NAD(P)-dependent oxidoreductase [Gemmatimonadales bacterium]|jgi:3-oxoacyl-[acyl-carrier protein] reductase